MLEKQDIKFDEKLRGRRAECFGASPGMLAALEGGPPEMHRFEGTLTGEYYVDRRWTSLKWYRMVNLTEKPQDFEDDDIWCDWGEVWILDETPET